MNKICLLGRLTSDPELRQTQSGVATCRFTIAVDRGYTDKQTGKREADFISCIAWKNTAEFVSRYFTKGKQIALEGALRTGKYTDKNHSDVTHYTVDVYVENVYFCGDKGSAQATTPAQNVVNQANTQGVPNGYEVLLDDNDPPF